MLCSQWISQQQLSFLLSAAQPTGCPVPHQNDVKIWPVVTTPHTRWFIVYIKRVKTDAATQNNCLVCYSLSRDQKNYSIQMWELHFLSQNAQKTVQLKTLPRIHRLHRHLSCTVFEIWWLIGYKNCLYLLHFCYPSLIRRPRFLCSIWSFPLKLTVRKLESWAILKWRPHDRSWSRFGMIPACDGQTVIRSYGRTEYIIAITALCIASYADAL